MATVFLVTHGQKNKGGNPGMTDKGFAQIASLKDYLPVPSEVWIGGGQRHMDVCTALGLNYHPVRRWTETFGGCGSLEVQDGKDMLVFANGVAVPFEHVSTAVDGGPSVRAKLPQLPHNSVVCAGRECVIALGVPLAESKSAAIYVVEHDGEKVTSYHLVHQAT